MVEESIQEGEVRDIGGKIAWADRKKQKLLLLLGL